MQDALGLPDLPERIECFDISHIQGAETVASLVVWEDGRMKKSDYRKFIIRGEAAVEGEAAQPGGLLRDDFSSMREVLCLVCWRILNSGTPLSNAVVAKPARSEWAP